MSDKPNEPLHASAFAYNGAGCLILGAAGTGKSRITAEAIQMGAKLIADDRVQILPMPMQGFVAAAPVPELAGVLELHGIGLVRMNDALAKHVLHLVVELDPNADERIPTPEKRHFLGVELPYLRIAPAPQTSGTALLIYLKAMQEGRVLPVDWMPKRATA